MTLRHPSARHQVGHRLSAEDGVLLDRLVASHGLDGAARRLGLTTSVVTRMSCGGHGPAATVERVAAKLAALREAS